MKQILYGIGKLVLRDYRDRNKIIGFADLQDLTVESSYSKEDITGGNKMFPIASFKKDQALKLSGTNACFDPGMLQYLDGAAEEKGAAKLTGFLEVTIPDEAKIILEQTPIDGSVVINGFTAATGEDVPTKGQFKVATATKEISFANEDVGQAVIIVYEYTGSEKTTEYSVGQKSMSKPFVASYIFDIFDEDTQVKHKGEIRIYKAQCSSGFSIDPKHQSPVSPKFEAEAKDPMRTDLKLWSLFIDDVEV